MYCVNNGATTVLACSYGYYLNLATGVCVPCPSNTKTCISGTSATSCNDGFYLLNQACSPCSSGALYCADSNTAVVCKTGFYIAGTSC